MGTPELYLVKLHLVEVDTQKRWKKEAVKLHSRLRFLPRERN